MIQIKSHFTEWHEVSMEVAVAYYRSLSDIARRKCFDRHFRGVSREELEAQSRRD